MVCAMSVQDGDSGKSCNVSGRLAKKQELSRELRIRLPEW